MNTTNCYYAFVLAILVSVWTGESQVPKKQFIKKEFDSIQYSKFETNKRIPSEIRAQVLTALSYYPELKDTKITFRFRKRTTPLSSRPRLLSIFKKAKNRNYVITISTKSNATLAPILFYNLPYNAQIGVLGHELGHISEYQEMKMWQLGGLIFKMLNSKYIDQFEYNTDLISINHGLGYQLYDWSTYVRAALGISEWRGASDDYSSDGNVITKQRYMNPLTIQSFMDSNDLYKGIR